MESVQDNTVIRNEWIMKTIYNISFLQENSGFSACKLQVDMSVEGGRRVEGKISLPPPESPLNTNGFREKVEVEEKTDYSKFCLITASTNFMPTVL